MRNPGPAQARPEDPILTLDAGGKGRGFSSGSVGKRAKPMSPHSPGLVSYYSLMSPGESERMEISVLHLAALPVAVPMLECGILRDFKFPASWRGGRAGITQPALHNAKCGNRGQGAG